VPFRPTIARGIIEPKIADAVDEHRDRLRESSLSPSRSEKKT